MSRKRNTFIYRIRQSFRRKKKRLTITKRQTFVIITSILTVGILLTQLVSSDSRYVMILVLSLITYVLSAIGLREDLKGVEWFTLLMLPTLYTAAIGLFYFLLPVRWLTRIPVVVLYAVGMYALLLTENIYNIAAVRTIALLRVAHTVGFLLTLVTYYLLVTTILTFHFHGFINAISVGLLSFVLIFQSLWSVELTEKVSNAVWYISIVLTLAMIEFAWVFSFWPVKPERLSLFFTTSLYSMVAMAHLYLVKKLYKRAVVEFFLVAGFAFVILMVTTRWRGGI